MLILVCCKVLESKLVKLETIHMVILSPMVSVTILFSLDAVEPHELSITKQIMTVVYF